MISKHAIRPIPTTFSLIRLNKHVDKVDILNIVYKVH